MVLDPIPQSLPVHFFGSRPQRLTSHEDMEAQSIQMDRNQPHIWKSHAHLSEGEPFSGVQMDVVYVCIVRMYEGMEAQSIQMDRNPPHIWKSHAHLSEGEPFSGVQMDVVSLLNHSLPDRCGVRVYM